MTRHAGKGWDGPFPPRSRPIRVDGGIRARTTRGAIGQSWWSQHFLAVWESLALGTRLTRGRSYARAGQVLSLSVAPGTVTASVQGSRPQPYDVTISLAPFPTPIWERVERALAEQAIYAAQLLAGEMPPDIEEVFSDAGAPLFPRQQADLALSCTCPDPAVPCKHLAATCYLLAEAFDADPFQILRWRGRDRSELLARLAQLRGDVGATALVPASGPTEVVGAAAALSDIPGPPLAALLDRYWSSPVPLPARRPPILATEPDLLLRQLPTPGPELGGPALRERLRVAYRRFATPEEGSFGA